MDVNFLAVILYYNFERCCHLGKQEEGMQILSVLFLATVCDSTILKIKRFLRSKKKKVK